MGKIKDIFIYLGLILIIPIIFLIDTFSVKALEIPDLSGLTDITNNNYCLNVIVGVRGNDNRFFYACFLDANARGVIGTIPQPVGNSLLDKRSNYYSITSLGVVNSGYFWQYGYFSVSSQRWSTDCQGNCSSSYSIIGNSQNQNQNGYIVAVLTRSGNSSRNIVQSGSTSNILYYNGYNLLYYETPIDYFGTYTNTFGQPTATKGSTLSFSGDELTASVMTIQYSYYNSFMYEFNDIDNEDTLISTQFNYDNLSIDGNYKLGFVLTYKRPLDTPMIVHAVTNGGTYACNSITNLKSSYDIGYQWYVECPSVPFDNSGDLGNNNLQIVVNGSNEFYNLVGPVQWYDTNYIFNDSDNNKYVGISSILRTTTDTPPVPVDPDIPSEDDIIDGLNNINNNIMDPSAPDTSSLANSAGWLPAGPVDSIINLPITMLQSLNNVLSNSACTPVSIPIPFINYNYSLPCINTIISNMGFAVWWETIGTIASAFILYKYLVNLYAWVDRTLTFRDNNWNDWGGI